MWFKQNLRTNPNFQTEILVQSGWKELSIASSLSHRISFVLGCVVLCLLATAGISSVFLSIFGSSILTSFEPIFLGLVFVGVLPHELIHLLTFQKQKGKELIVDFCPGLFCTVVVNDGALNKVRLFLSLLAPLFILTVLFLVIAFLFPTVAGHMMLLAFGNAAWSGVDLYIALFLFMHVQENQNIHLASLTTPGVFVKEI